MDQLILSLAQAHPSILAVITVIGALRIVNKPLFAFLHSVMQATGSQKGEALVTEVETSKIYSGFLFLLDYVASVKPAPKPLILQAAKTDVDPKAA
jgi:hypothetical protein